MNGIHQSKISIPVLLITVLLLSACSGEPERPEDLISEENYIDIVIEFTLADAYQNTLPEDSVVVDSLYRVIFEKYDISREQFVRSHQYYQTQVDAQNERIATAIDRLKMQTVSDTLAEGSVENSRQDPFRQ